MINTTAQNALKNSVYNIIGFLLPVAVVIFCTPIIISHLGVRDYGIYVFLTTITVFLGLLDLGVSVATSKYVIEYYTTNQVERLQRLLYSMNTIYVILGCLYLGLCVGAGLIIENFFPDKVGMGGQTFWLFVIIGITGFLSSLFANFANILFTVQRHDLQTKLSLAFFLLTNLSMVILVIMGYRLMSIIIAQLVITLVSSVVYVTVAQKAFPILRLKYAWAKEEIVKNYKFGLSVAVNQISNSLLMNFDKLIIPIFVGPALLSYYSVPGGITVRISGVSGTLSSLLFPITVNLHSLNNIEKIQRVYVRAIRLIIILASAISFTVIYMADDILRYWISEDFAFHSTTILILLVITNFILALFSPLSNLLTAMGKVNFLTIGTASMVVINIGALCILLPRYGILGAAIAFLVAVLPIFYMFHYAEKTYFKISLTRHYLALSIKITITAAVLFFIEKIIVEPVLTNFMRVVLTAPLCVLIFLLLYKIFGFVEEEDWNDAKLFLQNIALKIGVKKT